MASQEENWSICSKELFDVGSEFFKYKQGSSIALKAVENSLDERTRFLLGILIRALSL